MGRKEKIKKLFEIFREQYRNSDLTNTSVIIAYYLLLSLFPLFIIVGNIIPLFGIDPDSVLTRISYFVPSSIEGVLAPVIENLLTSSNAGLISVSSIGLLWSASRGVNHIEKGINKAYGFAEGRSGILQRILSLLVLIGVLIYIVTVVVVFDLGIGLFQSLSEYEEMFGTIYSLFKVLKWPLTIASLIFLVVLLYSIVPATRVRLRDSLPGTIFTVTGWIILMESFSLYLRFSSRLNIYGALSSVFVLMFWLNFAALLVICGAILNSSIQKYRLGELKQYEPKVENKIKDKIASTVRKKK